MTDEQVYKEVSNSRWYLARQAVKSWYPYQRQMKSFSLFCKAFEANDLDAIFALAKRFKMTYYEPQIIASLDKLNGKAK